MARAWSAYRKWDTAARVEYIEEARKAVAIAPDYAPGHALLANGLANDYLVRPDDQAEVQRIRAIAERALALAPDDAAVLGSVGVALSFVGQPDEGNRYSGRAARKAPGSGILHWQHGITCVMVNRQEDARSHLNTAERLMPGSQLMWLVKFWQSRALAELGRWVEADAANHECISHNPTDGLSYVFKALGAMQLGKDADARKCIRTAQQLGCDLVQSERFWRRIAPNSPTLDADISTIRELYAATETASAPMPVTIDNLMLPDETLMGHELYRLADAKAIVIVTQANVPFPIQGKSYRTVALGSRKSSIGVGA
jgi:Flp pilus assembly protein TadD